MDRGDRKNLTTIYIAGYGDLGNSYTLWTAARDVFEPGQGASS
jgi:hypothetical protein